ncbi:DUF418 domain-containing protein [Bacillus cereus group sp. N8]|uniref:DUF418 domain-containing protein n=1 Tax=Bacillus proteolyticus TaxID=2026192 RepID=A0ABV3IBT4_9BACI|nr:DUF418 domain-containing protein [Bacillus cereus group sp. N8]
MYFFIHFLNPILFNRTSNTIIRFTICYWIFHFQCIISVLWRNKFSRDPIEWNVRKLVG